MTDPRSGPARESPSRLQRALIAGPVAFTSVIFGSVMAGLVGVLVLARGATVWEALLFASGVGSASALLGHWLRKDRHLTAEQRLDEVVMYPPVWLGRPFATVKDRSLALCALTAVLVAVNIAFQWRDTPAAVVLVVSIQLVALTLLAREFVLRRQAEGSGLPGRAKANRRDRSHT